MLKFILFNVMLFRDKDPLCRVAGLTWWGTIALLVTVIIISLQLW